MNRTNFRTRSTLTAVDARLAAQRPVVSGGGGPVVPPWLSAHAHEWDGSRADRQVPPLPEFGKKEECDQPQDQGIPPCSRVKQEESNKLESLDDYFCRGMDTSGPASWDRVLREMEHNP